MCRLFANISSFYRRDQNVLYKCPGTNCPQLPRDEFLNKSEAYDSTDRSVGVCLTRPPAERDRADERISGKIYNAA
jgi:hypothetical protein